MIFVIDNLKYNTDHMELISEKCHCSYTVTSRLFDRSFEYMGKNVKLWKSRIGNWLLTYENDYRTTFAKKLRETEAKNMLLKFDLDRYEELFGELEEA